MRNLSFGCAALLWLTATAALAQPAQVCIIRHAEESNDDGIHLSRQGRERAAALVPFFLETPEVTQFKSPVAIYALLPKKDTSSVRAKETVEPLADRLKLTINQKFLRDDYRDMVADVMANARYKDRMVLISWEHKVIPNMIKEFGVNDGPEAWPGKEYDRVWMITFKRGQKPDFVDLPQRLMFNDKKE